jgi:hypothetical protein
MVPEGPTCHVYLAGGTPAITADDDPNYQKTRKISPSNPQSILNPIVIEPPQNNHWSNSSEHQPRRPTPASVGEYATGVYAKQEEA